MADIHPLFFSIFKPHFTHCVFDGESIELTEQSEHDSRCRVQIESSIRVQGRRTDPSRHASRLLSAISTLSIKASDWSQERDFFSCWFPAVQTLFLSGSHRETFTGNIFSLRGFPKVTEMHLSLQDLDEKPPKDDDDWYEDTESDDEGGGNNDAIEGWILDQIRNRNQRSTWAALRLSPLARLFLYERHNHTVTDEMLDALGELVDVEVRDQDDYNQWHWDIRARGSNQWWPEDPHPLRPWLSKSASLCKGCNGVHEENSSYEKLEVNEYI